MSLVLSVVLFQISVLELFHATLKTRMEGLPVAAGVALAIPLAVHVLHTGRRLVLRVVFLLVDVNLKSASNASVLVENELELIRVHLLDLQLHGQGMSAVPSSAAVLDAHDVWRVFVAQVLERFL